MYRQRGCQEPGRADAIAARAAGAVAAHRATLAVAARLTRATAVDVSLAAVLEAIVTSGGRLCANPGHAQLAPAVRVARAGRADIARHTGAAALAGAAMRVDTDRAAVQATGLAVRSGHVDGDAN